MNDAPKRIIRNTLFNGMGFIFMFVSNFLLVPFVIRSLGTEVYGSIWVVIGALTAYIGLLDLGTTTAFVKYIAEYHERGEEEHIVETVNSGMALYFVLSSVIVSVVLLFGRELLTFVGVPPHHLADALAVLSVSAAIFLAIGISSPVTAILTALQRMDQVLMITIAAQCTTIAGTILVLSSGWGVRGLILVNAATAFLTVLLNTILAKRALPFLRLSWSAVQWERCRQFLRFGMNIQVSKIGQIMMFQADRILTLKFFGATTIAQYDVAARLTNAARSVTGVLMTSLVPAVSSFDARQDQRLLHALFLRGTKYLVIVAGFFFLFIAVMADRLVRVWIGDDFAPAALYVRLLAVGYFFNIITGVASSMTAGMGRTDLDRNFGIIVSVTNLGFVIGGALMFGPAGIAVGTSLSFIIAGVLFIRSFSSVIGEKGSTFYRILLLPVIAAAAGALTVDGALTFFGTAATRWDGILQIIGAAAADAILFIVTLLLLGVIDEYDRGMAISLVRKISGNRTTEVP